MEDKEIDYSNILPLSEEFFERATLRIPASQLQQWVRIDPDILRWFQSQDEDYKVLINSVLRQYIETSTRSADS